MNAPYSFTTRCPDDSPLDPSGVAGEDGWTHIGAPVAQVAIAAHEKALTRERRFNCPPDFTARDGLIWDQWGVAFTPAQARIRAAAIASIAFDDDREWAEVCTRRLLELVAATIEAETQSPPPAANALAAPVEKAA